MATILTEPRPPKIPEALYAAIYYFLPRLLFLQSSHAAQIHWGDIVLALQHFPSARLDLSSAKFWESWMKCWCSVGDKYCLQAEMAPSTASNKQLLRTAAACYHWAEFMYFSDRKIKTILRQKIKKCFSESLDYQKIYLETGVIIWNKIDIPFYLVFPKAPSSKDVFPCVLLSNGLDSVTELEIFSFAEQFLSRGIATLLFDGPGQGINLGQNPLELRFERVVATILDSLKRSAHSNHINMEQMGFFGVSFGGYFALRIAQHMGDMFKAVINLSGGPYLSCFTNLPRRLKEDFKFAFMEENNQKMLKIFEDAVLDQAQDITTGVLSIHGALDDIFPVTGIKQMASRNKHHQLKIYASEAHACLNYINEYSTEMVDWMYQKLSQ